MKRELTIKMKPHHVSAQDYSIWPGWRLLMQDAGIASSPVLRRAGLPGDLFSRQNVRLNPDDFFKLWSAIEAEALAGCPDTPVPLQIAKVMTSDWFDPELFAALCSANLQAALDRMGKYIRLIAPMILKTEQHDAQTQVTIEFMDQSRQPPDVFLMFKLVFFVQLARLATRTAVTPLSVSCPRKDENAAGAQAYSSFFGTPVSLSHTATIVFSNEDIQRPFLTENHRMWNFFEPSLRQRLADLDKKARMAERVHCILLESLPAGETSMLMVCRKLSVSSRTLQRRLQNEGTSFQQLLDKVRQSLTVHYLRNTSMSGAEISFLLGFEDANSFSRAFHSWTGKTPQSVREYSSYLAETSAKEPESSLDTDDT